MIAKSFADLIGGWPQGVDGDGRQLTSIATFAADLGIPYEHAQIMRHRNSIAADHWPAVIKSAKRRGYALTHEHLVKLREKLTEERRNAKVRPSHRAVARSAA